MRDILKSIISIGIIFMIIQMSRPLYGMSHIDFQNGSMTAAQEDGHTINGKISDNDGLPIPGVSIMLKGTSKGTITNIDGEYVIQDIPDDGILIFSFVGMETQEIRVGNQAFINVLMSVSTFGLEEVVAIGYGSQRKKDLTGAVASVSTDELESLPMPSIGDAMQGKASGVQVTSSGTPGSDSTFRIRGIGTINNSDPLLVIDGVPSQSGLNQISMNDVESIQILKDASATAIYGSRGANGVIIITTKIGKSGKEHITINAYYGVQEATNMVEMLSASEFAALHNEMMIAAGELVNPAFSDPVSLGEGTDWLDEMFTSSPIQNYSLSYSGGNDRSSFYVAGNYFNQEGIVINTGFERIAFKINTTHKILKKIRFGNNITLNHDKKYNGDYSIIDAMRALPTQAVYNNDNSYAGPDGISMWSGDVVNPVGRATIIENTTLGYNLVGSSFGELTIIPDLVFKSLIGIKANLWESKTWSPEYNWMPTPQEQSYLGESWNRSITWNWDNTLTYKTTIADVHALTVLVGMSAQENTFKYMNGSIQEFASDVTQQFDNGLSQTTIGGNSSEWALFSYMGRINYGYNNKYLLTGTLRYDGSSRFGDNNKWGLFPSGSFAWRMSEERFLEWVDFIDDLKLRVGYGVTGNQEIGNYSFASALSTVKYNFNDNLVSAVVPSVMPNPNVQWESQKQTNIGFDATIIDQRLNITFDAYLRNTEDMLVPASVPITTGYSDVYVPSVNAGEIENKGIELGLTSHNFIGDFTWDTDFNISVNRNEVKSLNDTIPMARGSVGFNQTIARLEVGQPMDVFYGAVTDGIFQNQQEVDEHALQVPGDDPYARTSPGDIRFLDLNSDGVIDDDDRTYIGDPNPDFIFALNNTFTYKGFDLNIFIQGVVGNDIYNANKIWSESMAVAQNQTTGALDRWTAEGSSTTVPRAVFNDPNKNIRPSNRFVEDGSYLRVKSMMLGYTLPQKLTAKASMQSARIYFSGTNLFTITDYSGFDPEVGTNGIDLSTYPVTKTLSLGLNISF